MKDLVNLYLYGDPSKNILITNLNMKDLNVPVCKKYPYY